MDTFAVALQNISPDEHSAVLKSRFENHGHFGVSYEFTGVADGVGQVPVVGGDEYASGEHLSRQRAHLNALLHPAIVHADGKLRVAHLQVFALGALQSRHEFRLADLAGGIHGNRSVNCRQKSGGQLGYFFFLSLWHADTSLRVTRQKRLAWGSL